MTDADRIFLEQFHTGGTENSGRFSHREHLRLAWEVMRAKGLNEGLDTIRRLIRGIAQSHGDTLRYHETLTLFWGRIIHHTIQTRPQISSFDRLLAEFPFLLDKSLPLRHWSAGILLADSARRIWTVPDLRRLPDI